MELPFATTLQNWEKKNVYPNIKRVASSQHSQGVRQAAAD